MAKKKFKRHIIRTSRWSYFIYYLMIIAVLAVISYIKYYDLNLDSRALVAAILFCIVIFKATEVHRLSHYYSITAHGLEKVEGIFVRKHKRLNYGSISQLHLTQNPLNKIIDIGTVEVAQFSETVRTEIKNINKPAQFVKEVSKRMHVRLDKFLR